MQPGKSSFFIAVAQVSRQSEYAPGMKVHSEAMKHLGRRNARKISR